MRRLILFVGSVLITVASHAQDFRITRFEIAGDKLLLFYDLVDTVKSRVYTVTVYSSIDKFLHPVKDVSGDVGLEVVPGLNKKVVWEAKKELGAAFEGGVAMELRGRVYIPFVRFSNFEDFKVRKRATPFTITWAGGTRQNILTFDLYKGDTKVWTQANVGNTGHYELTIPKSVKPGSGYRFRVSDSKNADDVVYTGEFRIKRKIPLLVQAVPAVVVGGALYLIFSRKPPVTKKVTDAPCPDGTNNCNE